MKNSKMNDFFTKEMQHLVKKINNMAISGINIIYIYPLIGKLRRYIFSRKIHRPEAPKEKYRNLKVNKDNFTKKEDGTYDMHSGEKISFNSGYQISFETNFDSYSNKEYDEIAYKMSLMSDNHIYLGVYNSIPEMSFHFNDFELANVLSIIFNQTSIWDWKKNDEIRNVYYKDKGKKLF
jgi:hypothetical protein